jgi:hypothetical protein
VLLGIIITNVFRLITLSLWMSKADSIADSVFNRLTWISFVLTYMLLVFGWIETVHLKYPPPSEGFVPVLKWIMIGVAAALFLTQMITLIAYLSSRDSTGGLPVAGTPARTAYDANIWIFNIFLLAISLAFLVYGFVLLIRLNRGVSNRHSVVVLDARHVSRQRAAFLKIIIIMAMMSACFVLRLAMFMVRPLGGCLPIGVFWAFAYIVPEVLPAIIQMFVIISTAESKSRASMAVSGSAGTGGSALDSTASTAHAGRPLLGRGESDMEVPEVGETFSEASEERFSVENDLDDESYSHIEDGMSDKLRSLVEQEDGDLPDAKTKR